MTSAYEESGTLADWGYTLDELRAIARRVKIPGRGSMSKKRQLVEALNDRLLNLTRQFVIARGSATVADVSIDYRNIGVHTPDMASLNACLGALVARKELGVEGDRYFDGKDRCPATRTWPRSGHLTQCEMRAGHEKGENPTPHYDGISDASWLTEEETRDQWR